MYFTEIKQGLLSEKLSAEFSGLNHMIHANPTGN
jgi:hypothetical protein